MLLINSSSNEFFATMSAKTIEDCYHSDDLLDPVGIDREFDAIYSQVLKTCVLNVDEEFENIYWSVMTERNGDKVLGLELNVGNEKNVLPEKDERNSPSIYRCESRESVRTLSSEFYSAASSPCTDESFESVASPVKDSDDEVIDTGSCLLPRQVRKSGALFQTAKAPKLQSVANESESIFTSLQELRSYFEKQSDCDQREGEADNVDLISAQNDYDSVTVYKERLYPVGKNCWLPPHLRAEMSANSDAGAENGSDSEVTVTDVYEDLESASLEDVKNSLEESMKSAENYCEEIVKSSCEEVCELKHPNTVKEIWESFSVEQNKDFDSIEADVAGKVQELLVLSDSQEDCDKNKGSCQPDHSEKVPEPENPVPLLRSDSSPDEIFPELPVECSTPLEEHFLNPDKAKKENIFESTQHFETNNNTFVNESVSVPTILGSIGNSKTEATSASKKEDLGASITRSDSQEKPEDDTQAEARSSWKFWPKFKKTKKSVDSGRNSGSGSRSGTPSENEKDCSDSEHNKKLKPIARIRRLLRRGSRQSVSSSEDDFGSFEKIGEKMSSSPVVEDCPPVLEIKEPGLSPSPAKNAFSEIKPAPVVAPLPFILPPLKLNIKNEPLTTFTTILPVRAPMLKTIGKTQSVNLGEPLREKLPCSPLDNSGGYQSVYEGRLKRGRSMDLPSPSNARSPIKDISDHLEISRDEPDEPKPSPFPRSPDQVNFDLEVARKMKQTPEPPSDLPEIVDASQRITKSKAKKRKGKSKIPQRQDSKDGTGSEDKESEKGEQESTSRREEVVWDFEDRKDDEGFLKEERLRHSGYDTSNGKSKESGESGTESDSRGSPQKHAVLSSPGKRTIASSSGSDVALHEGAELSPDDNTDVVGADGLRQSMQNILDQFMNEERRFDNQ